jgi:hypothetical protein
VEARSSRVRCTTWESPSSLLPPSVTPSFGKPKGDAPGTFVVPLHRGVTFCGGTEQSSAAVVGDWSKGFSDEQAVY